MMELHEQQMNARNTDHQPMLKQLCWKDRDDSISMYGKESWYNMLDMHLVRRYDPPGRHDGVVPAICRLCDLKGDDQGMIQTAKEHWHGKIHLNRTRTVRV